MEKMDKLKKVAIVISALLIAVAVYLFSRKNKIKLYLHIANPSENIDLSVKIDNRQIFNDSLHYHPYKATIIEENLRLGTHTVSVSSRKAGVRDRRKIFVFFDQYIFVQYYPKDGLNEKGFDIDNFFKPIYFE